MKKKHFALLGYNLSHTLSPCIHKHYFETFDIDAEYEVIDIPPEALDYHIPYLKSLDGFNVTIPYKQKIISYLDKTSEKASLYGSVNTVKNNGLSIGYTTDAYGFTSALDLEGIPLKGKVVILGCGGAARVFAYEAALRKCKVVIAVREKSFTRANLLYMQIKKHCKDVEIEVCKISDVFWEIDLLINATPVGMYPNVDESLVDKTVLKNCSYVFDAIYNPLETKLIKQASQMGCKVSNGLSMLILQAIQSEKIWND